MEILSIIGPMSLELRVRVGLGDINVGVNQQLAYGSICIPKTW